MIGHNDFRLKSLTTELLTTTLIGIALLGPAAAQAPPGDRAPMSDDATVKAAETGNLSTLLPLLLTSPDRRRLAADIEAFIRTGDLQKAETSLNAAIEVGTLAIVLVDHLRNPDLADTLKGLGIRDDAAAASEPASAGRTAVGACPAPPVPAAANLAEMQQALEQERSYSSTLSQNLASLVQERNALQADLKKETEAQTLLESEVQQAVQREQDQGKATREELARLQDEYRALQATRDKDRASAASNASELDMRLRQERERGDNAERQLAGAERRLRDLQAVKDERAASESARVAELEKALVEARRRSDALSQELADATGELRALQEPHRPSATPVVFRLAAAGAELPLAAMQQETPPQATTPPSAAEEKPSVAAPGRASPEATSALPKEPAPVVIAALPDGVQPLPLGTRTMVPTKVEPPPGADPKANAPMDAPKADDRLTNRAEELFHKGDVSGARLLLERAMGTGNARAAFLLAETFDPNVLSRMGVLGIRGDAAKAREFYAQARAMGIAQAGERMEALK